MVIWNKLPILRLLLPFVIGILVGIEFLNNSILFLYALIFLFFVLIVLSKFLKQSFLSVWGYLLTLTFFILGYFSVQYHTQIHSPKHFSNYSSNIYKVKIIEPAIVKQKSVKLVVSVNQVVLGSKTKKCIGNALLYVKRDSLSEKLDFEDEILINADFSTLSPPQNPQEFDYKTYLSYHNIYHQKYLQPKQWSLYHKTTSYSLLGSTNLLRNYFLAVFAKFKLDNEILAVTSALVLGYKENLTDELAQSYSSAGAMHVLAVSGLHVGIIYVIFNSMLFFFGKSMIQRITKAVLLIVFLWFYAALTGMSPSVMRAATMFTAVVIGSAMGYKTNIYNTLSASAIILMLFNPFLLVAVGFQLSYLAVLGIVFLQPKIYELITPKNWLLENIWVITSVSIAAQIATFPLGLYYFHQFPNYFLVSNLIVIPFATLILYLGLALLTVSPIVIVSGWVSWLLIKTVWVLNYFVKIIEILPFSMTQEIHISKLETNLLYVLIITLILVFTYRKVIYLIISLGLITILTTINVYDKYISLNRNQFIVYNVKNTTALDFISGNKNYFFSDSILLKDENRKRFHIKHNWGENNITSTRLINLDKRYEDKNIVKNSSFYEFKNLKILNLHSKNQKYITCLTPLAVDYIIVSNNYKFDPTKLKGIKYKQVIFDSSNKNYATEIGIKACEKTGIKYYSVPQLGAFVVNL